MIDGTGISVGVGVNVGVLVGSGFGDGVAVGVGVKVGVGKAGSTGEFEFCASGVLLTTKSLKLLPVSYPFPSSTSEPVVIESDVEEEPAFRSILWPFSGEVAPSVSYPWAGTVP